MNTTYVRPTAICICLFSYLFFFLPNTQAQCSSSGPRSGSTFSDDNAIGVYTFSLPGNAAASDDNRASASAILTILSGNTHYLKATDFGFAIPVSASICGIMVEVEKSATGINILATVSDNAIRLIKGGAITGNNYAAAATWPSSESYYSYGGPSDQWGTTWTPADINAANFGVVFSAGINGIIGLFPSARIDHIRITISYFDVVLALVITKFSAIALDNHSAKLEWITTNNHEEVLLNIQRSSNGSDWAIIHDQQAAITRDGNHWQYTDINCPGSTAYYRLQVQEPSGRISYSKMEQVKWQPASLNIYPNPATDHLFIEQKEQLRYIRCVGMDARNWSLTYRQAASDLYQIDVSKLPRGTYILCINEKRKLFLLE